MWLLLSRCRYSCFARQWALVVLLFPPTRFGDEVAAAIFGAAEHADDKGDSDASAIGKAEVDSALLLEFLRDAVAIDGDCPGPSRFLVLLA